MLYRLWFSGPGGNPLTFTGVKHVHDDPGLDVWRDTSTSDVRILDGHVHPDDDGATDRGAGSSPSTSRTSRSSSPRSAAPVRRPMGDLSGFGRLFLGELWDVYGKAFSDRSGRLVKSARAGPARRPATPHPATSVRWLAPRADPAGREDPAGHGLRRLRRQARDPAGLREARRHRGPTTADPAPTSGSTTPRTPATASMRPSPWPR